MLALSLLWSHIRKHYALCCVGAQPYAQAIPHHIILMRALTSAPIL